MDQYAAGAPTSWGALSLAALMAIIIIPPVLLVWVGGVSALNLLAGGVLWAVSVGLKRVLAGALNRQFRRDQLGLGTAALQGFLSAATELGVAGAYLWHMGEATLLGIVAFGAGAGCTEALYVVGLGIVKRASPEDVEAWERAAAESIWVRYTVPLERFLAAIGHTGSRGLVWLGLHSAGVGSVALLTLALALFAAVDAVAVYGHQRNWDWNNPDLCRRLQLYFGLISLVELALFLALFPAIG